MATILYLFTTRPTHTYPTLLDTGHTLSPLVTDPGPLPTLTPTVASLSKSSLLPLHYTIPFGYGYPAATDGRDLTHPLAQHHFLPYSSTTQPYLHSSAQQHIAFIRGDIHQCNIFSQTLATLPQQHPSFNTSCRLSHLSLLHPKLFPTLRY
jgi:hypothetical protein